MAASTCSFLLLSATCCYRSEVHEHLEHSTFRRFVDCATLKSAILIPQCDPAATDDSPDFVVVYRCNMTTSADSINTHATRLNSTVDDNGPTSIRNAAACSLEQEELISPTTSTSDSKRSEAANLARELASSSPWSDAFMPSTYGTVRQSHQEQSIGRFGTHRQVQQPSFTAAMRDDLDPPPAYSDLREIHELPANPVNVPQSPANQSMTEPIAVTATATSTDNGQDENEPAQDATLEEPLLEQGRCRNSGRHHRRWHRHHWKRWQNRGKRRRERCSRFLFIFLCLAVSASVIFAISSNFFSHSKNKVSALVWSLNLTDCLQNGGMFDDPSRPIQTLVPTGPTYRYHNPTGNIHGLYKLYDRIELSTTTGTIDVEIDPQDGDDPAVLFISSDIGSVTVRVNSEYIRRRGRTQRPIYTEIRSFTGSISAEILLGNGGMAFVDSTLGTQMLEILTYKVGGSGYVSNLTTSSTTGTQKIDVISLDQDHITDIRAEHRVTATGSMDITYPNTWLGEVHVISTPLGTVNVAGQNLDYKLNHKHEIIAHRGPAAERQKIEIICEGTGSAAFRC